jgi:uncharacterized RDD family membrane protein YckC
MRAEPIAPVRASYLSRSRGVAWVVDALVVVGTTAGLAAVLGVTPADEGNVWDWLATTPGVVAMLLLGFLYLGWLTPSTGGRCGQSLGKRLVGLRVTRRDGRPPGRARILARAAWDTATVGVFLTAATALVPDDAGAGGTPAIVAYLVTPCLLIAWVTRDKFLDIQLSHRT